MVRDDFRALSYVFGEEWTAANQQGRLLPERPNRVGTLIGYLFLSETPLNFDQYVVVRVVLIFRHRMLE